MCPPIEPYASGMLDTGDGNAIYWETCGNPSGKPAVVLHGGPGSGATPWWRRLFNPDLYRIVLLDQRGCGRSTPHAATSAADFATNTTAQLVSDIERLRTHLGIERWLILGGSWGCTLALAYAEAHAAQVTEMVLFGITTGRRAEFDWTFRGGMAAFFPEQWQRLVDALPPEDRAGDIVEAYHRQLMDRTLRSMAPRRKSGASGNRRRRRGRRFQVLPRGFMTPNTVSHSPASSPTM